MANNDIRMRVMLNVDGKSSVVEVSSSVKELQNALEATKNKASAGAEGRQHQTKTKTQDLGDKTGQRRKHRTWATRPDKGDRMVNLRGVNGDSIGDYR